MQRMWPTKKGVQNGFTLIEVLIIAPIVILAISGFVALMITMIGDSLATRDQNNLTFETQDALDRIEEDTRLTTQFLATTNTLPSPQGSDNNFTGTAAFSSSSGALLMGGLTTTTNPVNISRQLVFYANQPNDCGALQKYNRPFQQKIIYYVYNGSLWRRAVVPDYNTNATVNDSTVCNVPWQQNSCSPGYTASRCQRNDIEVMKNIDSFSVKYLTDASSDTNLGASQALSANAIEVSITGKKTVKGRVVSSQGTIRGTKLNSIDVDPPVPNAPVVTGSNRERTATFTWSTVPSATSYVVKYNINGGSWSSPATLDNRTLSYTVSNVPVNGSTAATVGIQVVAQNSTGASAAGTASTTMFEYGLVGWWPLNGNAQDQSGNGYDGTLVNGPTSAAGAGGVANTGMSFNGTNQYINLGNPAQLPSGTSPRTMCVWANTDTTASTFRQTVAYGSPSASAAMFISLNGTTVYGGGYGNDITAANYWQVGAWKHRCLTYDGSTAVLYSFGGSIGSGTFTWNLVKSKTYIGRQVNDAEYWDGTLDDVRIYKRALSASEIMTIYNRGAQ